MASWIKNVKNLIRKNKTDEAFKELNDICEDLNEELEDKIILLNGRWSSVKSGATLGVTEKEREDLTQNKIHESIIKLLREIKEEFPEYGVDQEKVVAVDSLPAIQDSDEEDSLKEVQEALSIIKQIKLDHNTSEEDLKKSQELKRKILDEFFGELDESFDKIENLRALKSGIYFDQIFAKEKLDKQILQEIATIRSDKKNYHWYDRSLIISAITLSLIDHKFDAKKLDLLIDFLTDFEDEVWQRALVGIVLSLLFHQNRIKRFSQLVKRLQILQNLPHVQNGLITVDFILMLKLYEQTLFNVDAYKDNFFLENPKNCFIPFFKDNPILEDALDHTESEEIEQDDFIEYLYKRPLLSAHKYFLAKSLKENNVKKEILKGKKAKVVFNTLNLSKYFHPFQNLITEFYLFYSFYPKNKIKSLFKEQLSLSDAKLKDLILAEKEKLFLKVRSTFNREKYTLTIELCEKYLKTSPNNIPVLEILAQSAFQKKLYHKAIDAYNLLLKQRGGNSAKYNNRLGIIHVEKKLYQEALKFHKKAVELNGKNGIYLNDLGIAYWKLKEYDEALLNLKRALKIEPDESIINNSLGITYAKLENYDLASIYCKKAVEKEPKHAGFNNNLGTIYFNQKEYELALKYYKIALDQKPKNSVFNKNLGDVYFNRKNYNHALKYYRLAIDIEPKNADYINSMATTLFRLKKYNTSLNYCKKILELEPNDSTYLTNYGALLLYKGYFDKAEEALKKAISIVEDENTYHNLGNLELVKGNIDKAIKFYRKFALLIKSTSDLKEKFDIELEYINDLGIDTDLYNQIKEEMLELRRAQDAKHKS